jgi:hypothetical protein
MVLEKEKVPLLQSLNYKKLYQLTWTWINMYAAVVAFVAGSLEAGGLPGYPEVLISLK